MISGIEWTVFALGLLAGSAAAGLFFAGLAWGVHLALRRTRPIAVLLPSAALRIGALMAAGWWIAGLGMSALAGFVLAFVIVRFVVLGVLRSSAGKEAAQWS